MLKGSIVPKKIAVHPWSPHWPSGLTGVHVSGIFGEAYSGYRQIQGGDFLFQGVGIEGGMVTVAGLRLQSLFAMRHSMIQHAPEERYLLASACTECPSSPTGAFDQDRADCKVVAP